MAKQKYDWSALKLDFFNSDIDEVKEYIKHIWGNYNRNTAQATRWRAKEKQAYKEKILAKVLERKAKEEAKNLEIPVWKLKEAKKAVVGLLMKKISDVINEKSNLSIKDQERILKMIKTELGEPTTISKNDTTIKWEILDEKLFIQD